MLIFKWIVVRNGDMLNAVVVSEHESVDLNQRGLTGILDEKYTHQVKDLEGIYLMK